MPTFTEILESQPEVDVIESIARMGAFILSTREEEFARSLPLTPPPSRPATEDFLQ